MAASNFIDQVKIYLKSGSGGAGSVHFRREKYVPKGGPDGGDGGRGGHIILKGNSQLWTLLHLKYKKHITAGNGENGGGNNQTGANGKDEVIEVPVGTIARDSQSGEILVEITEDNEQQTLLEGGIGGLGNSQFKGPTQQTPRYAQPGKPGQEAWIILELKILADVGLVGFPNAGKSTLLSFISAAKPEIADYPFTTLVPNLGVVSYRDDKSFVMADIPGIIEGASSGKGLGTRFLRHIERNPVLLFMVSCESKDIKQDFNVLLNELKEHNPELLDKRRVLAVTKSDLLDEELEKEMMKEVPSGLPVVMISSVSGNGITELKDVLWEALKEG